MPTSLVFDLEFEGHAVGIYGDEIWRQKTRITGLPCGEEIMIVEPCESMSMTDRQTDRRKNGQIYDD